MAGLIEGLKGIYSGDNVLIKHINLFILCAIYGVIASMAVIDLPEDAGDIVVIKSMLALNPIYIILLLIAYIILFAYWIMFIHKSLIRFSMIDETSIMPDIDEKLIAPAISTIPLTIVWVIYGIISMFIPIFNIFWALIILPFCMPYVYIAYCKDFSTKGLFSPKFVFDILVKVFVPTLILSIKYFFFCLLFIIPLMLLLLLFSIVEIFSEFTTLSVFMAVAMYLVYIFTLLLSYCQAHIYAENVYEINSI